jgi:hypothetical protein
LPIVLAQAMLGKSNQRDCLSRFRSLAGGDFEELSRLAHQSIAEQGTPDLEHEFEVILVTQVEDATESS